MPFDDSLSTFIFLISMTLQKAHMHHTYMTLVVYMSQWHTSAHHSTITSFCTLFFQKLPSKLKTFNTLNLLKLLSSFYLAHLSTQAVIQRIPLLINQPWEWYDTLPSKSTNPHKPEH